jgi:hypothetical protein
VPVEELAQGGVVAGRYPRDQIVVVHRPLYCLAGAGRFTPVGAR